MGPDSPCPPQCPAGWGKMPKWRPATTLDSPTAGRRRRRLRPSIGNGSPPAPLSPPARSSARIPPTRRPHPGPCLAAPRPDSRPAPRPLPPRPARGGERPPLGAGREMARFGDVEGRRGFGGPAAKMASRGLGAQPPPPPGRLGEGTEAEAPIAPSRRPRPLCPHLRSPSHLDIEKGGRKECRAARPAGLFRTPPVHQSSLGAAAPGAQITCRFLGYFYSVSWLPLACYPSPANKLRVSLRPLGSFSFPSTERCKHTNHL